MAVQLQRQLQQIIIQSRGFPRCYFLYATTPSFFDSYGSGWLVQQLGLDNMLELDPLDVDERRALGTKIAELYGRAADWEAPSDVVKAIHKAADLTVGERVGDYVRKIVAILDEKRAM